MDRPRLASVEEQLAGVVDGFLDKPLGPIPLFPDEIDEAAWSMFGFTGPLPHDRYPEMTPGAWQSMGDALCERTETDRIIHLMEVAEGLDLSNSPGTSSTEAA